MNRTAVGLAMSLLTSGAPSAPLAAAPPSPATLAAQRAASAEMAADDRQDFAFADRGFLGTRKDPLIKTADGRVVWNLDAYSFAKGPAPATVNPSLWRQAQLLSRNGLFQVTDGVWQVRGFDLANVTFIRGKTAWIVIDPLTSAETAKAAYDLVTEKLGPRPIAALIYTHPHVDHFGGARGIVAQADVDAGRVQVIAPEGFLEHAVSENVIAGNAMSRRATYQFGTFLPAGPEGQVNAGIGEAVSRGTQTLVAPTISSQRTGQELTVDGVRLQFQMTPGTEAPAEMNIYLPDLRTLCLAENANATLHNLLTPRGALVRDAKVWADGLSESLRLYGDKTDIMFTSHAWPRFGRAAIVDFVGKHRDAYKYLHDQSVRLMNQGLTGVEIGERLRLPPVLAREWYNHGYYGSLSFNARAVYQRYMGWYDANPVHLAPYAPAEESRRYVAAMGGADKVRAMARDAAAKGDNRWAAELLNRLVFAGDASARPQLAESYDQLGYRTENALFRNMYLSAAQELRGGIKTGPGGGAGAALDLIRNTPTPMLLDLLAVRLNPEKVGDGRVVIDLVFPDRKERSRVNVEHAVLTHDESSAPSGPADLTLTLPRSALLAALFAGSPAALQGAGGVRVQGDLQALTKLAGWLDSPKPDFPLVWPQSDVR